MSDTRLMAQPGKTNAVEAIIAHYIDERAIKLTPVQNKQRQRCEAAFTMLLSDYSITEVVKRLCKLYGISKAVAYRTIHHSEIIFGSVKKFNKDAWKYIQIERKRRYIAKCIELGKWELVEKFESQIDKLIGFDKDDLPFDPNKMKAQSYVIGINEKLQDALIKAALKGPVNFNDFKAEDIEYEEIPADKKED